jgi:BirA family biotin operon repressor/biotin-[acetyl-CoA-carboxylase] ligase
MDQSFPPLPDRSATRRVDSLLGPARARFTFEALAECSSTSTLLLERARQGAAVGLLLVADRQTAGRGRRGRSWLSTPDSQSDLLRALALRRRGFATRGPVAGGRYRGRAWLWRTAASRSWPEMAERHPARRRQGRRHSGRAGGRTRRHAGGDRHRPQPATATGRRQRNRSCIVRQPGAALSPLPDRHQMLAQVLIDLAEVLDRFADGGFSRFAQRMAGASFWQDCQVRLLDGVCLDREGMCLGADERRRPAATHTGRDRTLPVRRPVAAGGMIIAIDAGNSRIKWGVHDGRLADSGVLATADVAWLDEAADEWPAQHASWSATSPVATCRQPSRAPRQASRQRLLPARQCRSLRRSQ